MAKTFVERGKPLMVKRSKENSQFCMVGFLNGHFYGKIIEAFEAVDGWILSFGERYCDPKMSHLQNWYETTAWLKCLIIKQVFLAKKEISCLLMASDNSLGLSFFLSFILSRLIIVHSSTYSFSFQTDLLQAVHLNLLTNSLQNSVIKNLL